MNTESREMRRVADSDSVLNGEPGDYAIYDAADGRKWISMRLPSKGFCTLPLNHSNGWQWDGIFELPTLQPSVWHDPRSGSIFEWHGFIRNGRMESC